VDLGPVKSCLQQGRSAAFNWASKGKILDAVPLPEGVERFIQRTRFFTDAGIMGSREFVRQGFELFRDIIRPKRERKPHRIQGLDQVYSLKRLT
jgi:hypothetical protein